MKKSSRRIVALWIFVVFVVAGGTFLVLRHLGAGGGSGTDMPAENPSASSSIPMQTFSNDGYTLSIPADWNIERTSADTIALHPGAASGDAACKIEISAFPFSPSADISDWIANRIGADKSLSVTERSSETITLSGGGTAIKWMGEIENIPTTLIYAFNNDHAYEVAPSAIGGADGSARCDEMLEVFFSGFTI
jgi:hypothetical protein